MADSVTFVINVSATEKQLEEKINEKLKSVSGGEDIGESKVPKRRRGKLPKSDYRSPSPRDNSGDENRGGIYGGSIEGKEQSFKRMQAIRGAVPVQRDNVSRSPNDYERWIFQIKRMEDQISKNERMAETLTDIFKNHGGGLIQGGSGLLSNPESFITNQLTDILGKAGPYGALASALVGLVIASPKLYVGIVKQMAVKGAPFNEDFKVIVEEIVTGFLSLTDQHKRDLGIDGFIVSQVGGFGTIEGTDVENSRLESDEVRINRIGQDGR